MRKLPWAAFVALASACALNVFAGCGSDDNNGDLTGGGSDGGNDGTSQDSSNNPNDSSGQFDTGTTDANDGGLTITDGSLNDGAQCRIVGQTCGSSLDCCSQNCDGTSSTCSPPLNACKDPGALCNAGTECCTGACLNGTCDNRACVPDKPEAGACAQPGECCSGICQNNVCASVNPGAQCRTSGNPCDAHDQCCSKLCNNGVCSGAVSFCTQQNEVCSSNVECCSGNCVKQAGMPSGLCGVPTAGGGVPAGCSPSGTVCGGSADAGIINDGGVLPCEQTCCSRACGYFGANSGFRVCQPPSGCRPTGEVCRSDSDCCGWSGAPDPVSGPVTCSKASPTAEFGRCDNGGSCREPGSICKPGDGDSCSAENNCCEHSSLPSSYCNNNPENCCKKDALGIPRCLIKPIDCTGAEGGAPPAAGAVCATSADCCGNPCVNNVCGGAGSCVGQGGQCTTASDCCPGLPCVQAPGSTRGICGGTLLEDGGVSDAGSNSSSTDSGSNSNCSLYGQLCGGSNGDCCNGVPCTEGRCRYP